MTAEVMNVVGGLANGSADVVSDATAGKLHTAQDQEPKSKLRMGNGVHENGVAGHEEESPKALADSGVAEASGADDKTTQEDLAAPASSPAAESGAGQASDKGILGSTPPALAPDGDIPVFGEAPPAAPVKAPTRYDFYLVRVPRPDLTAENNRIRILDMEIAEKRERQTFISAALRLKQAARSEAQGALRGARDRARACAAEVRKKFDEAKPLQDMLRRLNDGRKDARAQGRNLEATSEAELNDMIAQKEYRMQHESISLNEEKQLMKEIKALEASRPKVREMQALYASVNESLGQKDAIQAQLKPLLAEAELLKEERDAAQEICKTFEAEAQVCEEAVQQLLGERAGVIQEQDAVYEERRALKTQAYKKEEDFRQYRRDYAAVQELVASKNIEALEKFCQEQRERVHAKLNKDAAYRKAYVAANQWSTIRRFGTLDTRRLGMDEDPATLLDATAGADAANKGAGAAAGRAGGAKAAPQTKEKEVPKRGGGAPEGGSGRAAGGEGGDKAAAVGASAQGSKKAGADKAPQEGKNGVSAKAAPRSAAAPAPSPAVSAGLTSGPGSVQGGAGGAEGAGGVSSKEAEKERRREEALAKAKEAEERKRKLAERAQQRAEAKAAKEAEEAAKRREKEKERKARRKAAAAADKAAKVAAGEEVAEGEEGENGEGGAEGTTQRDGAAEGEKEKGAKGKKKGKKGGDKDLSEEAEAALTKRQRKRLAAGRSKAGGEGAEANVLKKGARGGGETGPYVWMAAAAAALIILVLLFLGSKFLLESKPAHTQ